MWGTCVNLSLALYQWQLSFHRTCFLFSTEVWFYFQECLMVFFWRPIAVTMDSTSIMPRHRVGYWFSEKKSKKFNLEEFHSICDQAGLELVKVFIIPIRYTNSTGCIEISSFSICRLILLFQLKNKVHFQP